MVSIKPMFLYGVRGGVQGGVNFTGYPHASVVVLYYSMQVSGSLNIYSDVEIYIYLFFLYLKRSNAT